MKTSNLIRWSGPALMIGGILGIVGLVIHPLSETASDVASSRWVPAHLLGFVSTIPLMFGLIGLYARQAEETGRLGLLGFALTLIGAISDGMELLWIEVIIFPFLVANDPALYDALRSSSAYLVALALSLLLFFGGWITFGATMVRAAVLPRWTVWLVVMAVIPAIFILGLAVLVLSGVATASGLSGSGSPTILIFNIVGIVLSLSFVGWGYALWSDKRQTMDNPNPRCRSYSILGMLRDMHPPGHPSWCEVVCGSFQVFGPLTPRRGQSASRTSPA